ncbi:MULTISPECIES: AMP-binding protein [unclassified Psychrobacter]|uniref:AMP-binding protein n=1 Tax=unclassified Psychrobacter TaxID=196806 RepID=UPI000EBA6AA2|nr:MULTISPECIES: AMP-binding protein [unclassified Psychrobacter]MBE8610039.1 AMP-binding protein [Pseudomonas lundensis]HCI75548.1 long-chain fatty acid--CoA ligase [Psychrobacter sp.]
MDQFWTQHYPKGINAQIAPPHNTLIDMFDDKLTEYASHEFITNMGVTYTYGQVDSLSLAIAAWIQSLGLAKGSVIGIMMPNVNQYLPIVIGIIRAGMVTTLINPLYSPRELRHQLADSDTAVLFILEPFCKTLEKIIKDTPVKTVVISKIGDMLGVVKGALVNIAAKYVKKAIPRYQLKSNSRYTVTRYKAVLKRAKKLSYSRPTIQADDLLMLQYTGGTTGVAKGILITNQNVVTATYQFVEWFKPVYDAMSDSTQINTIVALPLYHIYAFICSIVGLSVGQHLTLVTNPRDIEGFIKILRKRPFHLLPGVNTLFQALLMNPKFKELDFSACKLTLVGGMAATPETAKRWREVTGLPILEGWGMSETLGVGTANPFNGTEYSGNVGLPLPSVDISIRDDDENILAINEVGEMCIKGDNVITHYHNIDNTTFFTADGYLKTGDIASMNEQGAIKIYDRKKDMIIVSGFNVYPNEVENIIEEHPKVAECSVVGIDDKLQGQSVKAYVVKSDDSLNEDDIRALCQANLAAYKCPRHIEFIDELPKSTVGKILRHKLRKLAQEA